MSIFGVDWNMDGDVDEMDMLTDMFIIDELEKEDDDDFDDFFDDDFDDDFDDE